MFSSDPISKHFKCFPIKTLPIPPNFSCRAGSPMRQARVKSTQCVVSFSLNLICVSMINKNDSQRVNEKRESFDFTSYRFPQNKGQKVSWVW